MQEHNAYKIYPKSIRTFIDDNYDLNKINFGNIENNVKAILQKLKIDHLLNCTWDINSMYFFDKKNITRTNNKPSDFDDFSQFNFIFTSLKESKSTKDYEMAIEKLETKFIYKYQHNIAQEHELFIKKEVLKKKRQKMFFYAAAGLLIFSLIAIVIYIKYIQSFEYQ